MWYYIFMKKLNYSLIDWLILIAFIFMCGIDVFLNFIVEILKVLTLSNVLGNPFDFVKFVSSETLVLFGIPWLSKLIFLLASVIPSLLINILFRGTNMPSWINYIVSILIYLAVVFLFSSYIFWIIIGVIIVGLFVFFIVVRSRSKNKSEKKV